MNRLVIAKFYGQLFVRRAAALRLSYYLAVSQPFKAMLEQDMPPSRFTLERNKWCGWQEVPSGNPGWGASPVFVTSITPLKTGKSILRIEFIHAMRPVVAKRRSVDLHILHRFSDHVIGRFVDDDGAARSVILAGVSHDWLRTECPTLLGRPSIEYMDWNAEDAADQYLNGFLGRNEQDILNGTTVRSFGIDLPPAPTNVAHIDVDRSFTPFESWLIWRGFTPRSMDDKWFIYTEDTQLVFRRSWTGILIFKIDAQWRGDRLHLCRAMVNRDETQNQEQNSERDFGLLNEVIGGILLAQYP